HKHVLLWHHLIIYIQDLLLHLFQQTMAHHLLPLSLFVQTLYFQTPLFYTFISPHLSPKSRSLVSLNFFLPSSVLMSFPAILTGIHISLSLEYILSLSISLLPSIINPSGILVEIMVGFFDSYLVFIIW